MEMVIGKSSQIQGELNLPGDKSSFKEPTAETDTISVTPSCFNASILALKFIFEGFIK